MIRNQKLSDILPVEKTSEIKAPPHSNISTERNTKLTVPKQLLPLDENNKFFVANQPNDISQN